MATRSPSRVTAFVVGVVVVAANIVAGTAAGTAAGAAPAPAGYVATVANRLAELVVDGRGAHAYATNPAQNEVEVLSLTTKVLEAPIPVGSTPRGLDLSA